LRCTISINLGDALLRLGVDKSGLEKGMKDAESSVSSALQKMQGQLKAAGAAFTAVGAAGLALVSGSLKVNASLAQVAITLGTSTKAMRDLTLSTTNVTFPIKSVTATFELLTRAGMRNTKEIKASAIAFDTLADATGSNAETMADILVPAFKVFGLEIPKTTAELDKFTWLAKNTTIDIAEFGSVMDYVAMYGQNLNVTIEDMIGIMAALEAKGMSGATATRLFRTAVNQAKDGTVSLAEALNLTQAEIDTYKDEVAGATGITQKYADAANTQYGIMDKLKQKWSEISLRLGSVLQPLEGVLGVMATLGPVMLFLSTKAGMAAVSFVALKGALVVTTIATWAQVAAQWALNVAMTANPFGVVAVAAGVLIGVFAQLDFSVNNLKKSFGDLWDSMSWHEMTRFPSWVPIIGDKEVKNEKDNLKKITEAQKAASAEQLKNELETISKLKSEADKNLADKIASIKAEYGYEESVENTKLDDAKKASAERKRLLDVDSANAQTAHERELSNIQEVYADTKTVETNLVQIARNTRDARIKALDAVAEKARTDHAERLSQIEAEYQLSLSDAEKTLQAQIDAIDEKTATEDLALTRATEQKRLAELEAAGDTVGYAEYAAEVARNEILRGREVEKDAIRDKITDLRNGVGEVAAVFQAERDARIKASNETLQTILDNTATEKTAADTALTEELTRIETARLAAETAENDRWLAESTRLTDAKAAEDTALAESLVRIATERDAAIAAETEKQNAILATIELRKQFLSPTASTAPLTAPAAGVPIDLTGGTLNPLLNHASGNFQIPEPTVLYGLKSMKAYGVAGEAGTEYIMNQKQMAGRDGGYKTANITFQIDGRTLARILGQPLVDEIRLRTGARA